MPYHVLILVYSDMLIQYEVSFVGQSLGEEHVYLIIYQKEAMLREGGFWLIVRGNETPGSQKAEFCLQAS